MSDELLTYYNRELSFLRRLGAEFAQAHPKIAGRLRLGELALDRLRFYLKGQNQHVFPLYQFLFKHTLGVAIAAGPGDPEPVLLGPECVRPVGFNRDEGLLPYPPRSFVGYRLLTE